MSSLTVAERRRLASQGLALPDGSYPYNTRKRARAALSYSSRYATPSERRMICEGVQRRFPDIHAKSCPSHVSRAERSA